jgi:hypothetical protein
MYLQLSNTAKATLSTDIYKLTNILYNLSQLSPAMTMKRTFPALCLTCQFSCSAQPFNLVIQSTHNPVPITSTRRTNMAGLLKTLVTTNKKYKDCKGIIYNPSFAQNTGLQKKVDATYKQNPS